MSVTFRSAEGLLCDGPSSDGQMHTCVPADGRATQAFGTVYSSNPEWMCATIPSTGRCDVHICGASPHAELESMALSIADAMKVQDNTTLCEQPEASQTMVCNVRNRAYEKVHEFGARNSDPLQLSKGTIDIWNTASAGKCCLGSMCATPGQSASLTLSRATTLMPSFEAGDDAVVPPFDSSDVREAHGLLCSTPRTRDPDGVHTCVNRGGTATLAFGAAYRPEHDWNCKAISASGGESQNCKVYMCGSNDKVDTAERLATSAMRAALPSTFCKKACIFQQGDVEYEVHSHSTMQDLPWGWYTLRNQHSDQVCCLDSECVYPGDSATIEYARGQVWDQGFYLHPA